MNFITHSIGASGWIFTNSNLQQKDHYSFASKLDSSQLVLDAEFRSRKRTDSKLR